MNIAADRCVKTIGENVSANDRRQVLIKLINIRHSAAKHDDIRIDDVDDAGETTTKARNISLIGRPSPLVTRSHGSDHLRRTQGDVH